MTVYTRTRVLRLMNALRARSAQLLTMEVHLRSLHVLLTACLFLVSIAGQAFAQSHSEDIRLTAAYCQQAGTLSPS